MQDVYFEVLFQSERTKLLQQKIYDLHYEISKLTFCIKSWNLYVLINFAGYTHTCTYIHTAIIYKLTVDNILSLLHHKSYTHIQHKFISLCIYCRFSPHISAMLTKHFSDMFCRTIEELGPYS